MKLILRKQKGAKIHAAEMTSHTQIIKWLLDRGAHLHVMDDIRFKDGLNGIYHSKQP